MSWAQNLLDEKKKEKKDQKHKEAGEAKIKRQAEELAADASKLSDAKRKLLALERDPDCTATERHTLRTQIKMADEIAARAVARETHAATVAHNRSVGVAGLITGTAAAVGAAFTARLAIEAGPAGARGPLPGGAPSRTPAGCVTSAEAATIPYAPAHIQPPPGLPPWWAFPDAHLKPGRGRGGGGPDGGRGRFGGGGGRGGGAGRGLGGGRHVGR